MKTATVRSVIALSVVLVFMMITAVLALFPLFSSAQVQLNEYADFFLKTASVYTGLVGVIIGYYFARVTPRRPSADSERDSYGSEQSPPNPRI